MSVPVLTFFNNKGGVGKTSLVYHLAWMFSRMGKNVLACDLDPQANLTAAFLDDDQLEDLWEETTGRSDTIFRSVQPLTEVGDIKRPVVKRITQSLSLLPGDLALAGFEDTLSSNWPDAMDSNNLYRPFRILSSFWTAAQMAAEDCDAEIVIFDVGPNLGAINRSALLSSDYVVIPLGADIFSLQGLKNLGPTLSRWKLDWQKRIDNWTHPQFDMPAGSTRPIGYVVQQHSVRLNRPVKAYDKWVNRIPSIYESKVLRLRNSKAPSEPLSDPNCLSTLKHYRSLMPMGQEHRKPIFDLTSADGALGNHAQHVALAKQDFAKLATKIISRMDNAA